MANQKISQLTVGTPVQPGDEFPINRGGVNFRVSGVAPLASPALTGNATVGSSSLVPASELMEATLTVQPADLFAMVNTPASSKTIVTSPGVGNVLVVDCIWMNFQYSGTPYTTGTGILQMFYSDGVTLSNPAAAISISAAQLNGTTSIFGYGPVNAAAAPVVPSIYSNHSLVANVSTSVAYAAGNSPTVFTVRYRIIAVA